MCPKTSFKALLLQEGILRFELSWTAVIVNINWELKNMEKEWFQKIEPYDEKGCNKHPIMQNK